MSNNSTLKLTVSLIAMLAMPSVSHAQDAQPHEAGMDHSKMMSNSETKMPVATEGGQGGFTAIAEIVALLQADPNTDWSKVNIDLLREHLVDMNELTMRATVKSETVDGKIVFTVTASGRALQAVHSMVPAHAKVLMDTTNWIVEAKITNTGAIMTLIADNPDELQKIKALGFFGVMATSALHQEHHVLMATGATSAHKH